MRTFVPQSTTKSRTRILVRTEAKKNPAWMLFFYYHWKWVVTYLLLVLAYYLIFLHNWSPITNISLTPESTTQLQFDAAQESIEQALLGKSFYSMKLFSRGSFVSDIQKNHPIIKNIIPQTYKDWTVTINILYHKPDLILHTTDNSTRVAYHNVIIPVTNTDTIIASWAHVQLPLTSELLQQFSGWLFWQTPSSLVAQVKKRVNFLSGDVQTTYYPGREKLVFATKKDTFIMTIEKNTLEIVLAKWKSILPYLPLTNPSRVDLSDPQRIIIQ